MTFSEYAEYVRRKGYFSVQLNDHRGQSGLTDAACELVFEKWLIPLLSVCQGAHVYRKIYRDRPYDATPPPRSPRPVQLSRTNIRTELDGKAMLDKKYASYWTWALKHANATLCISRDKFPVEELAKECWDPGILTNLRATVAGGAIQLAKREVAKQNVCCVFSRDSYSIECHIL